MQFDWIHAFSPGVLLTCLVGAVVGTLWGAMPGLSVNMALALLIGITYSLPTEQVVAFMLAVWIAGEFGGSIPAIMINIPGTPAAVPTQLAGYPLAKRGKGGEAIWAAMIASTIGGLAGFAFLVTITPLLARIMLLIGSWEMFLLALLGVVLAGSVSSGIHPLKGWAMGLLGLLAAMVGREPIYGIARWTFDVPQLTTGLGFLPVMVGLLAVSEAIDVLARDQRSRERPQAGALTASLPTIRRYWKSIVRSSLIGSLVGALPGAGASIASFFSFSIGERRCRRNFSRGDLEGVICSEVANNANVGGGLVPTSILGIPGSSAAALFMAALTLHGVDMGPTVQQDHPGFLGFMFAALFVSNIALLLSAPLTIRMALASLAVPQRVLMPVVLVLAVTGTFAASRSIWDVYVMFGAGLAGYLLKRCDFPLAPIVLGIILGPIADVNLRRAVLIADGDISELVERPAGLVLVAVLLTTIALAMRRLLRQRRDSL